MNTVSHHIDGWLVSLTVKREPHVRWIAEAVRPNRTESATAGTQYDVLGQLGARAGISHEKLLAAFGVEA